MVAMRFDGMFGERPGRHPQRLSLQEGQVARNIRITSQSAEPFWGRAKERDVDMGVSPRTLFRDRNGLWLEFSDYVHVCNTIIGNDAHDRVFFVGPGTTPRVSDGARRTSGTGPYPGASIRLGVPVLENPPTLTIIDSGDDEDEDGALNEEQSRSYLVTLVNAFGEEGPPSPAAGPVSVFPGGVVEIGLPGAPGGDYELDKYYIYRFTDGAWQYIGEAGIAATTFTDNDTTVSQEPLESEDWQEPPDNLESMIVIGGAFLAGHRSNEVLFSEFQLPHAWPLQYRQSVDYTVRAIGSFGATLVVLTNGPVYMAQGTTPAAMAVTETNINYSCSSAESVVSMNSAVVYASPDGLVRIGQDGQNGLVTGAVFTEREWRDLNPETIRATHWRDIYIATYDGNNGSGAFMFDPLTPDAGVIFLDLPRLSALYNFIDEDRLFMVDEGELEILEWDADDTTLFAPFLWRSRPVDMPKPSAVNVVRVFADSYPATLRLFADGEQQAETTVVDDRPTRVHGGHLARTYELEIESEHRTYSIMAATSIAELREV